MKANYMTILGPSTMRLVACLVAFPLIIMLSMNYQDQMFNLIGEVKVLGGKALNVTQFGSEPEHEPASINSDNILLDGLFASGFDQESCLSRLESVLYRKPSPQKPSPYLISKLRNYENLHKRCGPDTELYKTTLTLIESRNISSPAECNYVVWTAQAGLGNRILNIASAFLYSLLTNKILLVEFNPDMSDLFCEPFPDTSWLLPHNFPKQFRKFNQWNGDTLGNTLKNNVFNTSSDFPLPSHLYIFLAYGLTKFDMLFYCEEHHDLLRKIPWLVFRSDEYFIPSLFLIPSFQQELDRMFPDKETIFHHLGKYLFHPSNKAWGLITRFYESYLAKSGQIIGMQIRVFNQKDNTLQRVIDQILACTTIQENFLPQVDTQKLLIASDPRNKTSKAILIASLYPQFYDYLSKMYWAFPTRNGEVIRVFQPSHEEYQHFGDNMHNVKAWVEMYLLSMSNVLVTSSGSTFGYVAQGLGGLTPWILYRPENWKNSDPACLRGKSIEPCLHIPPSYDCKNKREFDMGTMVPYVKHCEDSSSGLRLINPLQ